MAATRAWATVLIVIVTVVMVAGPSAAGQGLACRRDRYGRGHDGRGGVGVGVGTAAVWLVGVDGGLATDPIMTSKTKIAKTAITADQMGWRRGHARFLGGLAC